MCVCVWVGGESRIQAYPPREHCAVGAHGTDEGYIGLGLGLGCCSELRPEVDLDRSEGPRNPRQTGLSAMAPQTRGVLVVLHPACLRGVCVKLGKVNTKFV